MAETTTTTTIPPETLGDRLRRARRHADLEHGDMAQALAVSRQTISNWENDHRRPASRAQVEKWAEVTGVDAAWLIGDDPGGSWARMPVVASWADQLMFELGGSYLRAA